MSFTDPAAYVAAVREAYATGGIYLTSTVHEWHLRVPGEETRMGTRGIVGFALNGEVKAAYNHFDSYPGSLGLSALSYARLVSDWDVVKALVDTMVMVKENDAPTVKQLAKHPHLTSSGRGEPGTWYDLMRHAQGKLAAYVQAGVMLDCEDFPADSLFCEYGYIVDLDGMTLEAYKGFQKAPHTRGRFAALPTREYGGSREYYPIALVATFPLGKLPADDEFLKALAEEDE